MDLANLPLDLSDPITLALAIGAALAPRFVAALVGLGLLGSFVTLPLWYWLLGGIA